MPRHAYPRLLACLLAATALAGCAAGADSVQQLQSQGTQRQAVAAQGYEDLYSRVLDQAKHCLQTAGLFSKRYQVTGTVFADRQTAEVRVDFGSGGEFGVVAAAEIAAADAGHSRVTVFSMPKHDPIGKALAAWSAGSTESCPST